MRHRLEEVASDFSVPINDPHPGLPICLAHDVTLTREVRMDQKIAMGAIVCDPGRLDNALLAKAMEFPCEGPK